MDKVLALLFGLVVGLALLFCFDYLVAWLAVAVLAGFGVVVPFWPTLGAVLLVQLLAGLLRAQVKAR